MEEYEIDFACIQESKIRLNSKESVDGDPFIFFASMHTPTPKEREKIYKREDIYREELEI